jgi:hypothetical protein
LVCGCVRPRAQRQIHSFRGPLIRCKQRNPLPAVAELGPRARRRCCWRNTKKQHRENNKRVAAAIVICDGSGERSNRVFSAQRKTPAWFAPEWVCSARSLTRAVFALSGGVGLAIGLLHTCVLAFWPFIICTRDHSDQPLSDRAPVLCDQNVKFPSLHEYFAWFHHIADCVLVKLYTCISNATKGMSTKPVGMCVRN